MKINGEYINSTLLKAARSISGFRNFERERKEKEIKKIQSRNPRVEWILVRARKIRGLYNGLISAVPRREGRGTRFQ